MIRILRALCVVALIVALVEAAPRADAAEPGTRQLGFSVHLLSNPDRAAYLGHAAGVGARTIRDENDNLRTTIGFDRYLASLAQEWLGVEAASVLPGAPEPVGLL